MVDAAKKALEVYKSFSEDISLFASFVCKDLLTSETPDFHKEIYDLVTKNDRVIIAAPRGFAKSSIVARIYVLWVALFRKRTDIVIISSSEGLAIEHLRWIKQTIENNDFIKLWGVEKSDKWTETHLGLKLGTTIINIRARGAGAQIRGFRPDCIVIDDIETDESVASEDQRRKIKTWLLRACLNSLKVGGQFVVIGTIIHPLSVVNDLLAMQNKWKKKKYQAYLDGRQEKGYELWPQLWPHDRLQARKLEIGTHNFATEFLNDPMSDENAPILDEHIRHWDELPKQYSCVIAIDPAYSEDEKADYKVAVLVGIDQNNNRYLIDYIRNHSSTGEFIDAILNLYSMNKIRTTAVGCPHTGGDKEFWNSLQRISSERGIYPPFVELQNSFVTASGKKVVNKTQRIISSLQPLFERGKYYLGSDHFEAREELLTIGSSIHDDLVDALAYAEQIITPQFIEDAQEYDHKEEKRFAGYGIEW